MKKILLSCAVVVFCSIAAFAQDGIQFNKNTWKEVLAKAKQENKLVFIDVYTSWCGPCKMMAKEVFTKKDVGDLFNASFINYGIDAEKGEGIGIAKKFEVRAFPTFLFVNGDGELVYRTTGYMPAPAFLKEAGIALKEKDDPKTLMKWEAEYKSGKRDKSFLLGYLEKRALLKLPSPKIIEEVFPLLTKADLSNKKILSSIAFFDPAIQYLPDGQLFNYVMKNYKMLDSSKLVQYPLGIMETGINNYFRKNIIVNYKEDMLPVMIDAYRQVLTAAGKSPAEIIAMEKDLLVQYYKGTKNEAKLSLAAVDYVNNGLMKLDIQGLQQKDIKGYETFMKPFLSGEKDSTKDKNYTLMKRLNKHNEMISLSYNLRSAADAVYDVCSNKSLLTKATEWAKKANDWFPHFSSKAVYSGLLFKTGHRQEAIKMMKLASEDSFLNAATDVRKLLLANVEEMKKGNAPKSLWQLPK